MKEIRERYRYNGISIVINLYLDYNNLLSGDRSLENKRKQFKKVAVFHYLRRFCDHTHPIFSPPSLDDDNFVEKLLQMAETNRMKPLLQAHNFISGRLNEAFELGLPVLGRVPGVSFEPHKNLAYRNRLLELLK